MATPVKLSHAMSPKTPMRTPLSARNPNTPFSPNDDDLERAHVRSQKAKLRRQAFLTPSKSKSAEKDEEVAGLSEAQMLELYQNCIKLAAENVSERKLISRRMLCCAFSQ